MTKNLLQDVKKRQKPGFSAYKKVRKYATILGIKVDSTELVEVLAHISSLITSGEKFLVVTPNPEIVMLAQDDIVLSGILNSAAISLPDGVGLVWASRWKAFCARVFAGPATPHPHSTSSQSLRALNGGPPLRVTRSLLFTNHYSPITKRISGVDVMQELVKLASERSWRVFLLGGKPGVAESAAGKIISNFKFQISNLQWDSGPWLDTNGKPVNKVEREKETEVIKKINSFRPHLLFVGFGAPKQEKWVFRNLKSLDVNCAMVVGGAFDYISGRIPRAPVLSRKLGFEWLFRLILEPRRIKRQLNLFKFIFAVIRSS